MGARLENNFVAQWADLDRICPKLTGKLKVLNFWKFGDKLIYCWLNPGGCIGPIISLGCSRQDVSVVK
jgi:hypothetical protein